MSTDKLERVLYKRRRRVTMAYKITDACIACGACASDCPVEAISEGDGIYVIDADACIDCGACAGSCPVEAPVEA
jgi:ferredoxin